MSVNGSLDDLRGLPKQDIATFLNSIDSEYLIENNDRGELARWGWGMNAADIELTPEQRNKIQDAYINYDMRPVRPRRMIAMRSSARVRPMEGGLTKKNSKKQSKKSKRRNKGKKKSVRKGKKSVKKGKKSARQTRTH